MTVGMMLVLILARIPVFGLLLPLSEILLAPLPPAASFLVRFFVLFCWCCSCLFLFLIIVVVITTMIFATGCCRRGAGAESYPSRWLCRGADTSS